MSLKDCKVDKDNRVTQGWVLNTESSSKVDYKMNIEEETQKAFLELLEAEIMNADTVKSRDVADRLKDAYCTLYELNNDT